MGKEKEQKTVDILAGSTLTAVGRISFFLRKTLDPVFIESKYQFL
jgi:hypothetical protein